MSAAPDFVSFCGLRSSCSSLIFQVRNLFSYLGRHPFHLCTIDRRRLMRRRRRKMLSKVDSQWTHIDNGRVRSTQIYGIADADTTTKTMTRQTTAMASTSIPARSQHVLRVLGVSHGCLLRLSPRYFLPRHGYKVLHGDSPLAPPTRRKGGDLRIKFSASFFWMVEPVLRMSKSERTRVKPSLQRKRRLPSCF